MNTETPAMIFKIRYVHIKKKGNQKMKENKEICNASNACNIANDVLEFFTSLCNGDKEFDEDVLRQNLEMFFNEASTLFIIIMLQNLLCIKNAAKLRNKIKSLKKYLWDCEEVIGHSPNKNRMIGNLEKLLKNFSNKEIHELIICHPGILFCDEKQLDDKIKAVKETDEAGLIMDEELKKFFLEVGLDEETIISITSSIPMLEVATFEQVNANINKMIEASDGDVDAKDVVCYCPKALITSKNTKKLLDELQKNQITAIYNLFSTEKLEKNDNEDGQNKMKTKLALYLLMSGMDSRAIDILSVCIPNLHEVDSDKAIKNLEMVTSNFSDYEDMTLSRLLLFHSQILFVSNEKLEQSLNEINKGDFSSFVDIDKKNYLSKLGLSNDEIFDCCFHFADIRDVKSKDFFKNIELLKSFNITDELIYEVAKSNNLDFLCKKYNELKEILEENNGDISRYTKKE